MDNLELDFRLTVAHVNTLLKHLGNGIYSEVAEVIQLLHGQAKPQIESAATATPPVPQYPTTDPAPAPEAAPATEATPAPEAPAEAPTA